MKREIPSILLLIPNALQCDLVRMALLRGRMNPIVCDQPSALRQHLVRPAVPGAPQHPDCTLSVLLSTVLQVTVLIACAADVLD
jgi:hypothetical protein